MAFPRIRRPGRARPLAVRFWEKVSLLLGIFACWMWTGALEKSGYGVFTADGGEKKIRATHAAWELAGEPPVPAGQGIYHTCDNRPCVNNWGAGTYAIPGWGVFPRHGHLWMGTHLDNMADMRWKGRAATGERSGLHLNPERAARGERNGAYTHPEQVRRGEQNGQRHTTEANVRTMRQLYDSGSHTQQQLADMFGLTQCNVGYIVRRVTWKHVS